MLLKHLSQCLCGTCRYSKGPNVQGKATKVKPKKYVQSRFDSKEIRTRSHPLELRVKQKIENKITEMTFRAWKPILWNTLSTNQLIWELHQASLNQPNRFKSRLHSMKLVSCNAQSSFEALADYLRLEAEVRLTMKCLRALLGLPAYTIRIRWTDSRNTRHLIAWQDKSFILGEAVYNLCSSIFSPIQKPDEPNTFYQTTLATGNRSSILSSASRRAGS